MDIEEGKARIEKLLSLNASHPAFIAYYALYEAWVLNSMHELGKEYTDNALAQLRLKVAPEAYNKLSVLADGILDLNVVRRTSSIILNRHPLRTYLFTREIAEKFLGQCKPVQFVPRTGVSLMVSNSAYQTAFGALFEKFRGLGDPFELYMNFRVVALSYLVRGILKPNDVHFALGFVEYMENKVIADVEELSIIDDDNMVMSAFSEPGGSVSRALALKEAVLGVFNGGLQYVADIGSSTDSHDVQVARILFSESEGTPLRVLKFFLTGESLGLDMVHCFSREDYISAQKVAQSAVNIYSPSVLLKTAINPAYEAIMYDLAGKEEALERSADNLALLVSYGVISYVKQEAFEAELKRRLMGG